jgi:CRP-like cAMP-binding protein
MSGFVVADDWIATLPEPVGRAIMAEVQVRTVRAGAEFLRAGDMPEAIYRVRSGFLKQTGLQENGERTLMTIYAPGACFAETALVVEQPLNHTTIALTNAVVECLPAAAFWKLYRAHGEIPDALCRKFAKSVRRAIATREVTASTRLGGKLALLFSDLAGKIGDERADGRNWISIPFTQFDIAAHFGVTRQSVQRELGRLKIDGLIVKQPGGWLVDLAGLRTTA